MTFLCYSSLIRSLPFQNENINVVQQSMNPILPYKIATLSRKNNTSRLAYNEFVIAMEKQKGNPPNQTPMERKWCRDIGCMHEGTLCDIRQSTSNTHLQTFHYRIVNRIIATNTFLFRIGKGETPLCTFCNANDETLYHILWDCGVVQNYLKEIISYFKETYNLIINFTVQCWFFPRVAEESRLNILIITIIKLVIFRAKYKKQPPSIEHFHSLLKLEAENEETSAIRKNATDKFLQKWENVYKKLFNGHDIGIT